MNNLKLYAKRSVRSISWINMTIYITKCWKVK